MRNDEEKNDEAPSANVTEIGALIRRIEAGRAETSDRDLKVRLLRLVW